MSVNPDELNIEITLDPTPVQSTTNGMKKSKLKKRGQSSQDSSLGEPNIISVSAL